MEIRLTDKDWASLGVETTGYSRAQPVSVDSKLWNAEHPEGFAGDKLSTEFKGVSLSSTHASDDDARRFATMVGEELHEPVTPKSKTNLDEARGSRTTENDRQYNDFKFVLQDAIELTLKDLDLPNKKALVGNDGQIVSFEAADRLLVNFRNQLVKIDPSRVDQLGSPAKAKNLTKQEQIFFKLVLQRELRLDFGDTPAGETNARYFRFTLDRARLDLVAPSARDPELAALHARQEALASA